MFQFHDVEQNTEQWRELRCGKLTSSNLSKVMANYCGAFGDPAKKLAINIAIEQITGRFLETGFANEHTERGHDQEPAARMLYEEKTFCTVRNGGFFCAEGLGCSPDGLVGEHGLIEIKSVIPSVHFANVKRGSVDPAYKWQCISNLKFTGREWLDFVSYCEQYPHEQKLFIFRLHKDDYAGEFEQIDSRTNEFMSLIDASKSKILNSNYCVINKLKAAS